MRISALHANHRRARRMLIGVVSAWGVLLILSHRRGPSTAALVLVGLLTLGNVVLYLRGAWLSRRLMPQVTTSSRCPACGDDLWESLRAKASACPTCQEPIAPAQYERIFGDPRAHEQ